MLEWMFFTRETATFIGVLLAFFATLIVLDLKRRSDVPRKGFLPMATTRGDRIFLGMATLIIIGILWLNTGLSMVYALILGIIALIIIVVWG